MPEIFKVRVVPNAPKSMCAGAYAEGVKIKIAAQAMDGKANGELVKFLSKFFGISKSDVRIVCGQTSRDKLVEIGGGVTDCLSKLVSQ